MKIPTRSLASWSTVTQPVVAGLLGVGIVSATMSLDSQFLALSSMFTHDILATDLRREADRRQAADLAGPLDGRGHRRRGLRGLAFRGLDLYAGRVVFFGIRRHVPAGLCRALLEAGHEQGAIASLLATAAAWLYLFADSNWGKTEKLFLGSARGLDHFVSAVTLVVVSLLTPRRRRKWSSGSSRRRRRTKRSRRRRKWGRTPQPARPPPAIGKSSPREKRRGSVHRLFALPQQDPHPHQCFRFPLPSPLAQCHLRIAIDFLMPEVEPPPDARGCNRPTARRKSARSSVLLQKPLRVA